MSGLREALRRVGVPIDLVPEFRDWVVGHREEGIPSPRLNPMTVGAFTFDETSIRVEWLGHVLRPPTPDFRRQLRSELPEALDVFGAHGWFDDPRSYHQDPPPFERVDLRDTHVPTMHYEHLRAPSGYEPHPDEPGRERWLSYRANRTAHAWIVRHPGPPRPWLVCVNGYRTNRALVDFIAFRGAHLFHDFGFNLAFPVLPLQGPRRMGGRSGDGVLDNGILNTVHMAAQAAWDIRRLIGWLRTEQDAPVIGASGISLGGYLVSLLAGLEPDLSCVIAGVPETDLVRSIRRLVQPWLPPFYEQFGLSWGPAERVMRVVSPLVLEPLVPHDRRFIYAGLVDRWVRPGHIQNLWEHWDRPELLWYQGSHFTFLLDGSVAAFVDHALERTLAADGAAALDVARASAQAAAEGRALPAVSDEAAGAAGAAEVRPLTGTSPGPPAVGVAG